MGLAASAFLSTGFFYVQLEGMVAYGGLLLAPAEG